MRDFFSWRTLKQLFGYGAVGILNTALNFLLINIGIYMTGAAKGLTFLALSFGVFVVIVFHSFLWNRLLIFKRENPRELHREYLAFFSVTSCTALLNLLILHILVNVLGAPAGISEHLWANVAIAVTIPVSVLCNFLGYKLFVFRERSIV